MTVYASKRFYPATLRGPAGDRIPWLGYTEDEITCSELVCLCCLTLRAYGINPWKEKIGLQNVWARRKEYVLT